MREEWEADWQRACLARDTRRVRALLDSRARCRGNVNAVVPAAGRGRGGRGGGGESNQRTVLHKICRRGFYDVVRLMPLPTPAAAAAGRGAVPRGDEGVVCVGLADAHGRTALMDAAAGEGVERELVKIVRLLLKCVAVEFEDVEDVWVDVFARDDAGHTAFMLACSHGHGEVARVLWHAMLQEADEELHEGCEREHDRAMRLLRQTDEDDKTAADLARDFGHDRVLAVLQELEDAATVATGHDGQHGGAQTSEKVEKEKKEEAKDESGTAPLSKQERARALARMAAARLYANNSISDAVHERCLSELDNPVILATLADMNASDDTKAALLRQYCGEVTIVGEAEQRARKVQDKEQEQEKPELTVDASRIAIERAVVDQVVVAVSFAYLERCTGRFAVNRRVGEGAFGAVYRGEDDACRFGTLRFAVKQINTAVVGEDRMALIAAAQATMHDNREDDKPSAFQGSGALQGSAEQQALQATVNELRLLSRLRHPHVVRLLGWAVGSNEDDTRNADSTRDVARTDTMEATKATGDETETEEERAGVDSAEAADEVEEVPLATELGARFCLVYEFAERGSVADILRAPRRAASELGWKRRITIAAQIAQALWFLHTRRDASGNVAPVLHRDIKSANIVVMEDFTARLIDCGLALFVSADDAHKANHTLTGIPVGTDGYRDPQSARRYGVKAEIYAFGIVLLELITGHLQYSQIRRRGQCGRVDLDYCQDGETDGASSDDNREGDDDDDEHDILDWQRIAERGDDAILVHKDLRPQPQWDFAALRQLVRLARSCTAPSRRDRPSSMQEVYRDLRLLSEVHCQPSPQELALVDSLTEKRAAFQAQLRHEVSASQEREQEQERWRQLQQQQQAGSTGAESGGADADTVVELRRCCICLENKPVTLGVVCIPASKPDADTPIEQHFLCAADCLSPYCLSNLGSEVPTVELARRGARLQCPGVGCTCLFDTTDVMQQLNPDAMRVFLSAVKRTTEYETRRQEQEAHEEIMQRLHERLRGNAVAAVQRDSQDELLRLVQQLRDTVPEHKVLQCPKPGCGFGPIVHDQCPQLLTHHGESRSGGAHIDNRCPRCGFFTANVMGERGWHRWRGDFHPDFLRSREADRARRERTALQEADEALRNYTQPEEVMQSLQSCATAEADEPDPATATATETATATATATATTAEIMAVVETEDATPTANS